MELKDCLDKHVTGPVMLLLSIAKIKEATGYSFLSFSLNVWFYVVND